MQTYTINFPKRVISGMGSINQIYDILKENKVKNVSILTDRGVFETGIVDKILDTLRDFNINIIKDVPPEPEKNQVIKIYNELKNFNLDLIIAVGGGSVIDTTKIVASLLKNEGYLSDILDSKLITRKGIPFISVPTSAGTGAEATPNAIVLVPEKQLKVGIVSTCFISDYVILDPDMTLKLPPSITAATGLDAFCHAIECFISKKANPFSDLYALKAIELITQNIKVAYDNGENVEARGNMLLAAFYGGLAIASASTVAVHALSYPLGGTYRIPHGVSNAMLLPYVMEYNADAIQDKLVKIAIVMGIDVSGKTGMKISEEVIIKIFDFVKYLGIPSDLSKYGVEYSDLDSLVDSAFEVKRLLDNNPKAMSKEDIRNIYLKLMNKSRTNN